MRPFRRQLLLHGVGRFALEQTITPELTCRTIIDYKLYFVTYLRQGFSICGLLSKFTLSVPLHHFWIIGAVFHHSGYVMKYKTEILLKSVF